MMLNNSRFPQGLTLEQERARAIYCRNGCGFLVFWNTRERDRAGRPCLCDAIAGAPEYRQRHQCVMWGTEKREHLSEEKAIKRFIKSVRPSTAIAILGNEVVGEADKVAITENITFKKKRSNKKHWDSLKPQRRRRTN